MIVSPNNLPKLIAVAGPTCSGKTSVAIQLAKALNTKIISFDSKQCFREMSIGTAKPSIEELAEVEHFFIDNFSIHDTVNAGVFCNYVHSLLNTTLKHYEYIVLVGGTGLYYQSLVDGVDELPHIPVEFRSSLKVEFETKGLDYFVEELKFKDPITHNKIDVRNKARVMRAIELIRYTNTPYSLLIGKKTAIPNQNFCFSTNLERDQLYENINSRVDQMMGNGLEIEVKNLLPYQHLSNLRAVGYTEMFDYLNGKTDQQTAIDLIKQHTRNYAKRQVTWFKNQGNCVIGPKNNKDFVNFILKSIR